jgi:hypothetical protein
VSSAIAHRGAALGDHVTHALGDVWHSGTGLVHDVADATTERASDAGHAVGSVAERAISVAGELGRVAGHRAAAAAGGLRDTATDITGRKRHRRQRQAIMMRRGLVIAGVLATLGLLALAARRARQPWADEANRELEPGDPRADAKPNSSRNSRHYAAAT